MLLSSQTFVGVYNPLFLLQNRRSSYIWRENNEGILNLKKNIAQNVDDRFYFYNVLLFHDMVTVTRVVVLTPGKTNDDITLRHIPTPSPNNTKYQ